MASFGLLNLTNVSAFLAPCRKSSLRNVFLGSSLRKTGTTPTRPTSIGMEKKARFTLSLSTKMGHLETAQDRGDTRGLLTSCQGPSTRTEYRNCTGTYWVRAEIEGGYAELVRASEATVPMLPWENSCPEKKEKRVGGWGGQDQKECIQESVLTACMVEVNRPSLEQKSGAGLCSTKNLQEMRHLPGGHRLKYSCLSNDHFLGLCRDSGGQALLCISFGLFLIIFSYLLVQTACQWDRCQSLGLTTAVFCIFQPPYNGCYFNRWWKKKKKVIFHYSAWLVYTNDSFMHQKAVVRGLPDHGNDKDGFTLIQRLDAAQKTDFSFLFFLKKNGSCGVFCWLLLWCPVMEYCVWRKWEHLSNGDALTNLWQNLFLFMSFYFLWHTVYLFHIFIYFENIFLQVWD